MKSYKHWVGGDLKGHTVQTPAWIQVTLFLTLRICQMLIQPLHENFEWRKCYSFSRQLVQLSNCSDNQKGFFPEIKTNLLCYRLYPLLHIWPSVTNKNSCSPSSQWQPFKYLKTTVLSSLNVPFSKLDIPSSPNLSSYSLNSNLFIICVTGPWIFSIFSTSFLICWAQQCMHYADSNTEPISGDSKPKMLSTSYPTDISYPVDTTRV